VVRVTSASGTGGGGGGASEVGEDNNATRGSGGDGLASSITGSSVTRAGGGGGGDRSVQGATTFGLGGAGGGGAGASDLNGTPGVDGTANTGSGGGGAGQYGNTHTGGSGSNGIVIINYGTSSTYDSMSDVPTLTDEDTSNFATLNPVDISGTLSNGNLTSSVTASVGSKGTAGMSEGKWYWEVTVVSGVNHYLGAAPTALTTQGYVPGNSFAINRLGNIFAAGSSVSKTRIAFLCSIRCYWICNRH